MVFRNYQVGNELIGIRSTSREFGDWLDRTFAAYATDRIADHFYYSVQVPDPEKRGLGRRYTTLYERDGATIRTFSLQVIGRALINEFSGWVCATRSEGTYLDAGVVTVDGVNILVQGQVIRWLGQHQRRAVQGGLSLSNEMWVSLDPSTNLVERLPWPDVPTDAIERLAALDPPNASVDRPSLETPVRIDAACDADWLREPIRRVTAAEVAQSFAIRAINMIPSTGRILPGVVALIAGVPCYTISTERPQDAVTAIQQIGAETSGSASQA